MWDGNVEQALLMKANPEYYSDLVCRNGYFGGRHTVAYVRKVTGLLDRFRRKSRRNELMPLPACYPFQGASLNLVSLASPIFCKQAS